MRQIFLDTETTGLEHKLGHRIIEIGCVEMVNRRLTKKHFHQYINPERDIDEGAQAVHGISLEFLADKPKFADIAEDFLNFVRGAELIIHNAPFDIGFLNAELLRLDYAPVTTITEGVIDTLKLAKEMFPGKRNNLDALCDRFGIDNSRRTLHGALLDSEILADVYISMTRGQESLIIDSTPAESSLNQELTTDLNATTDLRSGQKVLLATDSEIEAHTALLVSIQKESKGNCVWLSENTSNERAN